MNRHTKLALFVAPFLIIGGYVAADFYMETKQGKTEHEVEFYELQVAQCQPLQQNCTLSAGALELQLSASDDTTLLKTNHILDSVTLAVVNAEGTEIPYRMQSDNLGKQWQAVTKLGPGLAAGQQLLVRISVTIDNEVYLNEFTALP